MSVEMLEDPTEDRSNSVRLTFEAGRIAESRGLHDCVVTSAAQVDSESPSGPPLIVTAERGEASESLHRSLAALRGAGRTVLLVCMDPVADGTAWLPEDLVHVVGQPIREPSTGTPEAAPRIEVQEPPQVQVQEPPTLPPTPPAFLDLRLFAGLHADPIGEAAERWNALRQNLRWPLDEVPIPEEGAYAWFSTWPLTPDGPAALIRFQPYEFAGVQALQVESAIGQVAESSHDLERVGSAAQQRFASEVTMQCEPAALSANNTASWSQHDPPAVARASILDAEPPLPLAAARQRLAVRVTAGTTGVYLHYLVPVADTFEPSVGLVVQALLATHRALWDLGDGQPGWLQDMHFTSAAELVLRTAQGQGVCGACRTVGLGSDEFCGGCGAKWR